MADPLHPAFQVCSNCYFFVNGSVSPGSCRVHVPDPLGEWPTVRPNDWCGEWRSAASVLLRDPEWGAAQTDGNGVAVFSFSGEYETAPHVVASVMSGDSFPYDVNVVSVTTTGASARICHGRALPGSPLTLPELEGYNVFGGGALSGITVTFLALPVEG